MDRDSSSASDDNMVPKRSLHHGENGHEQQQLFVKDPMSLMASEPKSRSPPSMVPQMSPLQVLQSQLGLTPQQFQVLMHHQQQLAFQSEYSEANRNKQLEHLLQMSLLHNPDKSPGNLDQIQHQRHLMSQLQRSATGAQNGFKRMREDSPPANNGHESNYETSNRHQLQQPKSHPLFTRGVCSWAGCETSCDSMATFLAHLNHEHILDERSTAQTRVQAEIVSNLQQQLKRETERLEAMRAHLDPSTKKVHNNQAELISPKSPELTGAAAVHKMAQIESNFLAQSLGGGIQNLFGAKAAAAAAAFAGLTHPMMDRNRSEDSKSLLSVMRNRDEELSCSSRPESVGPSQAPSSNNGRLSGLERSASGDAENEISKNRDFYRTHDVRPPFTYAALIRQAIIESPERQLTLNEIYTWFQNTFAFFRRNAATWKNAVRHNLSLHKCFMRVENVKGAVWTVDELEYHRRRPQRGASGGSGGGKSPTSYSSPVPSSGNSFFGDALLQPEAMPLPTHIAGLSFEHQAYLHNLSNPFQQQLQHRRNSDDLSHHGLNNNTISSKQDQLIKEASSPSPRSISSQYRPSPETSMHLEDEDDKNEEKAEDLSNKSSRSESPTAAPASSQSRYSNHPSCHSEIMIKSE